MSKVQIRGNLQRLLAIVEHLKTDKATIEQLADRYDVSGRTVYRYVRIIEEAGICIEQEIGTRRLFIASYPLSGCPPNCPSSRHRSTEPGHARQHGPR